MVEGRERFVGIIRYPRELRDSPQAITTQVPVPVVDGAMIPLGQLMPLRLNKVPPAIRAKNALWAYVYADMRRRQY
jgi:Cu(I)/Ag(I) efflux system membrane protein CusA/SilA